MMNKKNSQREIVDSLLYALCEKSVEAREHAERLGVYCHFIGCRLHFLPEEMEELLLLAILHDIGKIGLNPAILQKKAPLTKTEWKEMRKHPEIGSRIVEEIPEIAVVADFIKSHHERWDGNGYPNGLKGKEIPLYCRILAVVDAYDAMINDRIYRKALSKAEAINELKRNSGTQFDPAIVNLFIEAMMATD